MTNKSTYNIVLVPSAYYQYKTWHMNSRLARWMLRWDGNQVKHTNKAAEAQESNIESSNLKSLVEKSAGLVV